MAFLKQTYVSGNLYVTGSENFVSASEFRGNLYGTASVAEEALEAVTASHALDINPSANITVHNFTASGDAQVNGNLTVKGDLVYVGTTDLRVKDKYIELNVAPSGTTPVSADGAGIVIRNSEGTTGEDAAIMYDGTHDVLYFTKPISGSVDVVVDSASFADEANTAVSAALAEQAKQVLHDLKIGNGLVGSGSNYNGSADVNIAVDTTYIQDVKVNSASYADVAKTANKVDNQLSVSDAQNKGRLTGGPYDGSSPATISLDLSDIDTSIANAFASASASQADVDALETYVGQIPDGATATNVVDYIAEAIEGADIEDKIAGVLDSASAAQETADKAQATASANLTTINDLVSKTGSYVTSVTEGSSTENFVTFNVGGTATAPVLTVDDSALNTKITALETADTNILASASAAKDAADAAQETADSASAAAEENAQAIEDLAGVVDDLTAADIAAEVPSGSQASWTNVQEALNILEGRTAAGGVSVEKKATAEEGYFASYIVTQGGTQVGDTINIPKDYLVKSGEVKTCTTADDPVQGLVPGDKYLDFVVNTYDSSSTDSHIYIPVKDLTDVYTGADSGEITTTVDANNHISASIDNLAITGAKIAAGTITKDKLADAVTASLDLADSAIQADDLGTAAYENVEAFDASGSADTVGANVLASASNMSASLSEAIVTENSRSMAAESELSASIASLTAGMTVVETASGEAHLNVVYDGTNTYTVNTVDVASATDFNNLTASFNSYTQSTDTHLGTLDSASASLHTEVSGAQATADNAETIATAASGALATEISRSVAEDAALSGSIAALSGSLASDFVKKAGDTMTGNLVMDADIQMTSGKKVTFQGGSGQWDVAIDPTDGSLEFFFTGIA